MSPAQVKHRKTSLRGSDAYRRRILPYDRNGNPRTFAASGFWVDAQIVTVERRTSAGKIVAERFFTPSAVPAGQCRCGRCGHQSPPQLVSARGLCSDCQLGGLPPSVLAVLPGSPGVIDMRTMHDDPDALAELRYQAYEREA